MIKHLREGADMYESVSLLKRMSDLLDDLSPEDTIGFTNGARWIDVATVEEIRKAAYPSSPGKDGGQEVEAVVKPLAWKPESTDEAGYSSTIAKTPFGFMYDVWRIKEGALWNGVGLPKVDGEPPKFDSREAAISAANEDYAARVLDLVDTQPASTALVERLTKALQQIADARCDHDMGFDREIGPLGCSLGDKCVCVGLCTIASRALLEL
ncbi:hypothetical protein M2267_003080 [Ensifer sp. KUDG1]|uniref:hypothetical protein n=1 Tax=Ensifer sp. KUDG1 TaxID=3373919 RepID=UPI003D1D0405